MLRFDGDEQTSSRPGLALHRIPSTLSFCSVLARNTYINLPRSCRSDVHDAMLDGSMPAGTHRPTAARHRSIPSRTLTSQNFTYNHASFIFFFPETYRSGIWELSYLFFEWRAMYRLSVNSKMHVIPVSFSIDLTNPNETCAAQHAVQTLDPCTFTQYTGIHNKDCSPHQIVSIKL